MPTPEEMKNRRSALLAASFTTWGGETPQDTIDKAEDLLKWLNEPLNTAEPAFPDAVTKGGRALPVP